MISQQYIKDLEFKTIEDLFNYIVESEINGNYAQCKELLKKLSKGQFIAFCDWFKGSILFDSSSSNRDLYDFISWRMGA